MKISCTCLFIVIKFNIVQCHRLRFAFKNSDFFLIEIVICFPYFRVYISLFKGLGKEMDPEKNCNVTYAFLIDSMAKVMEIVITTLDPEVHDELVIAGNIIKQKLSSFC